MSFKKGAMYVFFANIINLMISLFTGFVLPKYLSVETYADIKLFQLYITYVGILHLGFSDGMYLRHGGKNIKEIEKKDILSEFKTFKLFQVIVAIIAVAISLIMHKKILLCCSLVIFPINVANYLKSLYQSVGEFKRYSRFTYLNTMLIFIINVILLFIIKSNDANLYIVLYVIAYFVYFAFIEIINRKIFKPEKVDADKKYLYEDIKSGFFLMIGNFCNVIFTSIDRIFVKYLIGKVEFAYYSFAVSIENLMTVFITPISTVMYNYLCKNREKENVLRIKRIVLLFSSIIVAVVFPAKFVIEHWIEKYNSSISVLFLLFAAQYISIMVRCVHINLYKSEKKQNRYFTIMSLIVILSIILNGVFFAIGRTMEMIALATLLTNIIWFVIGELDFKNYRLKIKDYFYTFSILIIFILCGLTNSSVIGFVMYVATTLIMILLLMPETLKYCTNEISKIIKNHSNIRIK